MRGAFGVRPARRRIGTSEKAGASSPHSKRWRAHSRPAGFMAPMRDSEIVEALLKPAAAILRNASHALPHLDVSDLHGGGASGVVCPSSHPALDSMAPGRFLHVLRLVESVLPHPGFLLHSARLHSRGADGPLSDGG